MKFRIVGMAVAFTSIAFLGYFSWSFSTLFDSTGNFFWALISLAMAVVLFSIECLDFWRVAGNKIGCDCCEKCSAKTRCLHKYQHNFFYRALLYVVSGSALFILFAILGPESERTWSYLGFASVVGTGALYAAAWRNEERALGSGDYEAVVGDAEAAGQSYAQKLAKEQAQGYADSEVEKLKSGDYSTLEAAADHINVDDVSFDVDADVSFQGTTEI